MIIIMIFENDDSDAEHDDGYRTTCFVWIWSQSEVMRPGTYLKIKSFLLYSFPSLCCHKWLALTLADCFWSSANHSPHLNIPSTYIIWTLHLDIYLRIKCLWIEGSEPGQKGSPLSWNLDQIVFFILCQQQTSMDKIIFLKSTSTYLGWGEKAQVPTSL